jgi:hypothetical protein
MDFKPLGFNMGNDTNPSKCKKKDKLNQFAQGSNLEKIHCNTHLQSELCAFSHCSEISEDVTNIGVQILHNLRRLEDA